MFPLSTKYLKNCWSWSLETWWIDWKRWVDHLILPPISNEINGAYYFAFVCPSVCPFVKLFCACHILRILPARVLKFYIWVPNEKIVDPYFFSCPACLFRVMSLWKKSELNLVIKISQKVFILGSWNYSEWQWCVDYLIIFWENSVKKIDKVMTLCSSAHFYLVSKMSRKVLKLGSWNIICWLGMMWRLPDLFLRNSLKSWQLWPFVVLGILTLSARYLKKYLSQSLDILYTDWDWGGGHLIKFWTN